MEIENVLVKDLKGYEKNAKKHPKEQIERIANSIKEFGFQQPLVIDKDNTIIITCECGHTAEYDESEIHSHRLICGDSTDIAVIDRLMDGVKADGIKRTD